MINVGKSYNALTGAELKETILNEVSRALDNAGINSGGVTYPQCGWSWALYMWQRDASGEPVGETPERQIDAGQTEDKPEKLLKALTGGSKRFKNNPPAPTEVREQEHLPIPEA